MRRICQNFFILGAMVFVLSGCSIVVFEDGPECQATSNCPKASSPLIDIPDDVLALPSEPEKTVITEPVERQPTSELPLLPPLVDGFLTTFSYDSAELGSKSIEELKSIAAFLADNPDITLIIEGHCDERGSRDYNLALGDRRAVAVRDVLTANGVDVGRIKTVSFGKERPIAVGSTPEIWQRNRRAVIRQKAS